MIDFTDKKILLSILNEYGLRLQKSLGQHFLINKVDLDRIVAAGEIDPGDTIIEIGTGVGVLTQELCAKSKAVIAFEMDERVAKVVREKVLAKNANLEFVVGDFLKTDLVFEPPFKVVANLPYQITTPVIRRFLERGPLPEKMAILIQKEVAERLSALPGSADRGWVTVLVQLFGEAKIVHLVPKTSFFPEPRVESAVLVIDNIKKPDDVDLKKFLSMVKAGFSSKRRQLVNSLAGGLGIKNEQARELLEKSRIDHKMRAEDLDIDQWKRLTDNFNSLS